MYNEPVFGTVRIGSTPAEALGDLHDSASVAVAVPDLTRCLDLEGALQAVRGCFPRMGPVVIGLGLHRRMTEEELAPLAAWRPIQHDPDDVVSTEDIEGIPGWVGRPIAQAPWSISVGVADLHQYAGLSGGHKGVAVGCGGRQTIAGLHDRTRVTADGVVVGALRDNPFRRVVDRLGQAARCRLALVYVPALGEWVAGEPVEVLRAALARMQPWQPVPTRYAGAVVHVTGPKAASFYQASRAATYLSESPSPPLVDGATIIVSAACTEGMGAERGFREALRSTAAPWSELLHGQAPVGAGAQRAVMLARLARRYRVRVMGCARSDELCAHGIEATDRPPPIGPTWLQVQHPFQQLPQFGVPVEDPS